MSEKHVIFRAKLIAAVILVTFLIAVTKYLTSPLKKIPKQTKNPKLKEGKVYFGSQFECRVRHDRENMAAGMYGRAGHGASALRDERCRSVARCLSFSW